MLMIILLCVCVQTIVKQSRKSAATSESHVANTHSEFQLQRDHEDTSKVNTAIFYSITSTLKGDNWIILSRGWI